ncbi:DUF742 domain-containing protein [Streptomyces sp. NBC_01497]|uniref:DUF742 domain-containing protein n=1 Tax=Streptomyces sp. NBC_01497 TaxID=2903885 RepID=UPI002E305F6F|nr:DUF742 domain-containing protein [Streptomyces sp. NBC_01497]
MTRARPGRESGLVRPYVVTGGRSAPSRNTFDQVTLVKILHQDLSRANLTPEQLAVLELCTPGALSVAEIGSHLRLPLSVLRIVLADLMETGHITTRSTILKAQRADRELLEAVLAGLQAL